MDATAKAALRAQMLEAERWNAMALTSDHEVLVESTIRFHALIHDGSGNAFLVRFLGALTPFDRTIRRRALLDPAEWGRDAEEHRAIVDAIDRADGDEAEQVMHEHIRRVLELLDRS
jgi:DNA-binding GntR family transcriptional regulator